jgi:hypothetical protein
VIEQLPHTDGPHVINHVQGNKGFLGLHNR